MIEVEDTRRFLSGSVAMMTEQGEVRGYGDMGRTSVVRVNGNGCGST
jgi:hypothetical protein